ncbi:MAG: hypothetical protein BMS9Abin31_1040 [Gammaproteobacteria bacterium]|nr:MAG: hypothetical protein BMS9Abin31_1040 [Gammaproteobacteria bacterium]
MKFFKNTRSQLTTFILMGFVFGMLGCSGGGGGTPPPPADAKPTGYYDKTGTVTLDDDGAGGGNTPITDLQAMINGNRFMMISDAQGLFYDGTITSITVNDFAANVSVFKHGEPITNPSATIAGTITEKSKIEGTITGTGAGNSNGLFTLQYAQNNNQAADLTRIERSGAGGAWDSEIGGAGIDLTLLEINAAGNIVPSGSAVDGFFADCVISSGSFTPISGTSLYNVTMSMTNCTTNGGVANLTYVGLAASWTNTVADDRLVIGATDGNSTYSVNGDFQAQ